jgi:unsaturated chondroitin disaccharide hydrolase
MIQLVGDFRSSESKELFGQAFQFAQKQVRKLIKKHPMLYPLYTQDGRWKHEGQIWTRWSDGFLPGMMWTFLKHADPDSVEGKFWWEQAQRYTTPLEPRKHDADAHDLGFLFYSTYYRWLRWKMARGAENGAAKREVNALKQTMVEAGHTLAIRFQDNGGYLKSFLGDNSLFLDAIMNVGLIFFAARETGDRKLHQLALTHAHTVRRVLVRGDGSTAQEGIFDTDTGEFVRQATHQGYRGDSCWSRGLTWAIYGFASCYEYTHDAHFLDTAMACADFYITQTPADGIPPWDFNAPPENRILLDTSAAAICAAALLRLCHLVPDAMRAHLYRSCAIRILRSLCDKHLAMSDPKWEGILKGGVYHIKKGLGVDESMIWGEYFFCEALERVIW